MLKLKNSNMKKKLDLDYYYCSVIVRIKCTDQSSTPHTFEKGILNNFIFIK